MAIPISYNLRNLAVRKTTTIMTALGIALTVSVLLGVMAMVEGLRTAFAETGDPMNVLVLRKGATSELASNFERTKYQDLKFKPGIAKRANGEPMTSLEVVTVLNMPTYDNPDGVQTNLRGLTAAGRDLRRSLRLVAGRWFQEGRREAVVGTAVAKRSPNARIGGSLKFGRGEWEIVGVMDAGRSAVNSEIWVDLNQAATDFNRSAVLSSALVRAADPASVQALVNELKADQRLNMTAVTETQYYTDQTTSSLPVQFLGTFVAIIMAVGSVFAAMNTMFAAVARRAREIGTLRVLGFSRFGILTSFFIESVLLSVLGGLLGCVLVLPLNAVSTSMGSWTTFTEVAFNFRVTPQIMAIGVTFAIVLGAIGGLLPARMAANKEILTALRES